MELQEVERSENNVDKDSYFVKDESVMTGALDVLTAMDASKRVVLLAKGNLIPNAVAIANIVTENMLKGNSKIEDIKIRQCNFRRRWTDDFKYRNYFDKELVNAAWSFF